MCEQYPHFLRRVHKWRQREKSGGREAGMQRQRMSGALCAIADYYCCSAWHCNVCDEHFRQPLKVMCLSREI